MHSEETHHDPFLAALEVAPIHDEPVTDEGRAAIEAGGRECFAGRTNSLEELLRRCACDDETLQ